MQLLLTFLALSAFSGALQVYGLDTEALRLCGDVHKLTVPMLINASASFQNGKCALLCSFEGKERPLDFINEAFPCPEDESGVSTAKKTR